MDNNYVVYARWVKSNGFVETETIDVGAINWKEAKKAAEKIISEDYQEGGEVYIITDDEGKKVWEKPSTLKRAS